MLQNGVHVAEIRRLSRLEFGSSIRMMEQITVEDIIESMHDADLSHSDAVILNAACMPGIERLRELELRLRKPVLQEIRGFLLERLARNWGHYQDP